MAQKILLILLITFTGRVLQSAVRVPFAYVKSGKQRVLFSKKTSKVCKVDIGEKVQGYKSLNCFLKTYKGKRIYKNRKTKLVFFASHKKKPQNKRSMAFIVLPLKKWGTLYFENDYRLVTSSFSGL